MPDVPVIDTTTKTNPGKHPLEATKLDGHECLGSDTKQALAASLTDPVRVDESLATADFGTEVPVGVPEFICRFLQQYAAQRVQPWVDRIVEIPDLADPDLPAVQTANLLLRWCVSSKCIHLLRMLPPHITTNFAADIDQRVRAAFRRINNIEESWDETARLLFETPMAYGGLGMRPLAEHSAAAFMKFAM